MADSYIDTREGIVCEERQKKGRTIVGQVASRSFPLVLGAVKGNKNHSFDCGHVGYKLLLFFSDGGMGRGSGRGRRVTAKVWSVGKFVLKTTKVCEVFFYSPYVFSENDFWIV
jgi:hypothetical protein